MAPTTWGLSDNHKESSRPQGGGVTVQVGRRCQSLDLAGGYGATLGLEAGALAF